MCVFVVQLCTVLSAFHYLSLTTHVRLRVKTDKRVNMVFVSYSNVVMSRKGKEEYLYSAFIQRLVSRRSDMDHTVLPACISFVSVHQMAPPLNVVANI